MALLLAKPKLKALPVFLAVNGVARFNEVRRLGLQSAHGTCPVETFHPHGASLLYLKSRELQKQVRFMST